MVETQEVQWVDYLSATREDAKLIIDFGERVVEIKRKLRESPESQLYDESNDKQDVFLSCPSGYPVKYDLKTTMNQYVTKFMKLSTKVRKLKKH